MKRSCGMTCALLFVAACSSSADPVIVERPALEHGRFLFGDPSASPSANNTFSCATCHQAEVDDDRILPGAKLTGVLERPSYWGGAELELLRAINHCRTLFMGAQQPWTAEDEEAKVMHLYLESLGSGDDSTQPFTVVAAAEDLPAGDAADGESVFRRSCQSCHGARETGEGRLGTSIPTLPNESVSYFESLGFDGTDTRVSFIEKARHGPFLGLYGTMPPYSRERLSDAQLGALLAYLGLY